MKPSPPLDPLEPYEFEALLAASILEWDAGAPLPSLDAIRIRGSADDYKRAVNALCDHDEARRLLEPPAIVNRPPNRAD